MASSFGAAASQQQSQSEQQPTAFEQKVVKFEPNTSPNIGQPSNSDGGSGTIRRRNRCSILDKSIQDKLSLSIFVGPQFQAALPPLPAIGSGYKSEEESAEDKTECLWSAAKFEQSKIGLEDLEEFVRSVAGADYGLGIDQALNLLFKSKYSLRESLSRLESFLQESQPPDWTKEELESFALHFGKHGKKFDRIAGNLSREKAPKECVRLYYRLKMKRCSTNPINLVLCPFKQIRISPRSRPKTIPKSRCLNCGPNNNTTPMSNMPNGGSSSEELPSQSHQVISKSKPTTTSFLPLALCPPCKFYQKKFGTFRPKPAAAEAAAVDIMLRKLKAADALEKSVFKEEEEAEDQQQPHSCILSARVDRKERRRARQLPQNFKIKTEIM